MAKTETVDIVYTWVDDAWPGHHAELLQHAQKPADTNPNRTRDNLGLLRYSLRSLEPLPAWVGKIHLFTCRPQVPHWLNTAHPQLRIVHHDEIIDPANLPTFNSFAINSHLHLLPGLSERFIYFNDDMVARAPLNLADFEDEDGRLRVFPWTLWEPRNAEISNPERTSPWNLAQAHTGALLDRHFNPARRRQLAHSPRLIRRRDWKRMTETFAEEFAITRASKFRAANNIVPSIVYPWMLHAEGKAVLESVSASGIKTAYVPLENFWPVTWNALRKARHPEARWSTFNDNFGAHPSRVTTWLASRQLENWFPQASRFEL
ncbi:stealth conserved region 3 domain-containing protein [Aestuariivirga litoralis]|uniref:stealth conserved region 3 domain-containing protein n=1 Tax=Aestuariivirga litoralis TaxID=2650924 RepID=UPI0018C6A0E0|nr:stealth conserved region 3 domain-containing protein [Aestuariivirga litoralis]MBG1230785.1 hypothetical protein [Aestuariivirga litoralis]